MMKIDLSGQHILVTGGSRGIGAALVRALAGAGARVALHYGRSHAAADALAGEFPGLVEPFSADLSDPAATSALWEAVVSAFGRVHCLVNNAGIALSSPDEASEAEFLRDWEQTMQVNLRAAAQLSRVAVGHFRKEGGGRLIHISSRAAFRGDTADYIAYAASKGGMVAMHRSIARAYGKEGVRSFLIAPGFTRTDMAQDFMDAYGEEYALNDIALERLTEPADLSGAVLLFASGLADHATGCSLDINAGSYVH